MTVPIERFYSIEWTRDFLRSLLDRKMTPRVPRQLREKAANCLRHFPNVVDMELAQRKSPETWGAFSETRKTIIRRQNGSK